MIQRQLRLYLIRHGKDTGDELGKFIDGRLTVEGEEQSTALATYFENENITELISSPMNRALATSQIIGDRLQLGVDIDNKLKDRDLGKAEGLTYKEVQRHYADLLQSDRFDRKWKFPEGESNEEVYIRAREFVTDLMNRRYGKQERIIIISHPLVLNYLLYEFLNIGFREGIIFSFLPASVATLEYQGTYFQLQGFGQI